MKEYTTSTTGTYHSTGKDEYYDAPTPLRDESSTFEQLAGRTDRVTQALNEAIAVLDEMDKILYGSAPKEKVEQKASNLPEGRADTLLYYGEINVYRAEELLDKLRFFKHKLIGQWNVQHSLPGLNKLK